MSCFCPMLYGASDWLVLAMDIFVLCFLAIIVIIAIHVVGLENYMVKMEDIFFFLWVCV